MSNFLKTAHHIQAGADDLVGNNGVGRYIFLPGSDGRAKFIAEHFDRFEVKPHARSHNLYTGTITDNGVKIDVAAISTGMGCPSMEIILHELFHLGGKRFLRVGTAGSLQTKSINIGDIINAQASVRDESTTIDYAPISVPAVASLEMLDAISKAALLSKLDHLLHTGTVHCKSSFYAREFYTGPKHVENEEFMELLIANGVLASEMETAALFIQSQLYHHQLQQLGDGSAFKVLCGAILGISAIPPNDFMNEEQEIKLNEDIVELAITTIKTLAKADRTI